ncbi:exonuclease domain-containing protein [Actinomadura namibiensis]|nr:exonuclease domain-containing protein [Actinomadura namibiensis]
MWPADSGGDDLGWACVDVETTGLDSLADRVLAVGVVVLGAGGEFEGEFGSLVNPGVDPGPVEVHGITVERLRGAPLFSEVAGEVARLLRGRVMVAHNAEFDYEFLAAEFARAGIELPVERWLCTLSLNRRIRPPVGDLQLGTLAAHYGAEHRRAHDALEDARALAGVLRGSLAAADRDEVALPLVSCRARRARRPPSIPKTPCPYRSPGRMDEGGPLVQGMKVAITGETVMPREKLVERAVAVGLNVMGSVSRNTSVLVTNDRGLETAKARRAAEEGVPVVDEGTFLRLLDDVRPGVPAESVRA